MALLLRVLDSEFDSELHEAFLAWYVGQVFSTRTEGRSKPCECMQSLETERSSSYILSAPLLLYTPEFYPDYHWVCSHWFHWIIPLMKDRSNKPWNLNFIELSGFSFSLYCFFAFLSPFLRLFLFSSPFLPPLLFSFIPSSSPHVFWTFITRTSSSCLSFTFFPLCPITNS